VTERKPVAQVNIPRADGANGIAVSVFQLDADGVVHAAARPASMHDFLVANQKPIAGDHGTEFVSIATGTSDGIAANAGRAAIGRRVWPLAVAGLVELRRIDVSSPQVVVVTTEQGSEITFGWKIWSNNCVAGGKFTIWAGK